MTQLTALYLSVNDPHSIEISSITGLMSSATSSVREVWSEVGMSRQLDSPCYATQVTVIRDIGF